MEARFASPRTYTPAHLAEKILTSRGTLEGERKLVTVVFVDVSGFTSLSERLDPEDVHGLMDDAFDLMLAEIHQYEGTVNQFLGDGLMALFGAPIGHEDHAIRAVHAALGVRHRLAGLHERLRAERGIDFQARQGLNTGLVVVGKIGDNLRMDYTAVGDTTNLAARLLALAEPGQILVSDEVVKVVRPYFVLTDLGQVSVKGKAFPVRAHSVDGARGVRSRLEAAGETGLTPLVGREQELALLDERFTEVGESRGQAVFVVGEAGIGKSRLLAEFRRRTESRGGVRWLTGRCISYGHSIAYLPILEVVRTLLGIDEGDSADAVAGAIERSITALGPDLVWTVPLVRALLSLEPGDAAVASMVAIQRHGRIMEAIRALLAAESQRQPVILLVEDLHWIDRHSEDVIRLVLDGIAALPVMVLLTARPGYSFAFGEQTYRTRIALNRLPAAQSHLMVDRVLDGGVPDDVRRLILGKAEGNPLFVEELARALVEDGTLRRENGGYGLTRPLSDLVIPGTIQGVIMARIDRLPEASKSALQIASVIGREFTARLVQRVAALERDAPKALGDLRAVELIYEKSVYPELAYMFKHALTHDVAYESLLRQRRRALHSRVGEVIEELYSDRLVEFYETLAWHYTRAEIWGKAADYHLRASGKARSQFSFEVAATHAGDAIAILDGHGGDPATTASALEMLGDLESLRGRIEAANAAYDRVMTAGGGDPALQRRVACKRHRPGVAMRDGARIAYYEHGLAGPTLFLMHPLFYGIATFQPLVELLAVDARLVTVDPRGTGGSDPLPPGYPHRAHVEDARAVIRALGDAPVVLVGISRGGSLAVQLAARYPDFVEALVLIGATPMAQSAADYPYSEVQEAWRRVVAAVEAGDHDLAIRTFLSMTMTEPGTQKAVDAAIAFLRTLGSEVIRNFFLVDQDARDIRPLLPGLRVRTLVIQGEADRLTPLEAGRYVAEQIPGARFHVARGRQHNVLRTAPAEVAGLIREFLGLGG